MIEIQLFTMKELMIWVTCLLSTPLSNNCLFNKLTSIEFSNIIFLWIYSPLSLVKWDHCVICCYCVCVCVCVLSCSVVSDSFATPQAVVQAPLSMGFPKWKYWGRLPFPSPGHLPYPGIKPASSALQADSLLPGKPLCWVTLNSINWKWKVL